MKPTPIMTSRDKASLDGCIEKPKLEDSLSFMAIVSIIDPFDIDIDQGQILCALDGSCNHEGGELRR